MQYLNSLRITRIKIFQFSSNNPKNVHATNEVIPNIKEIKAKINLPANKIAIAVVMRAKERNK